MRADERRGGKPNGKCIDKRKNSKQMKCGWDMSVVNVKRFYSMRIVGGHSTVWKYVVMFSIVVTCTHALHTYMQAER